MSFNTVSQQATGVSCLPTSCAEEANIQAYAKIVTTSWTYFVHSPLVTIGRTVSTTVLSPAAMAVDGNAAADIEVGDSKLISRTHASIAYNPASCTWEIICLGRNGMRVNNSVLKKEQAPMQLVSG